MAEEGQVTDQRQIKGEEQMTDVETEGAQQEEPLTEETRKDIQRSFRVLDVDKNGRISVDEVVNGVRVLGINPTQKEAQDIIKEITNSNNGFIEYEEYEKIMIQQLKQKEKEEILFMEAFKKFDKDGSGYIDFEELKTVLCGTGDRMTDDEVKEFFREADLDNDGRIYYKEFVKWFCNT